MRSVAFVTEDLTVYDGDEEDMECLRDEAERLSGLAVVAILEVFVISVEAFEEVVVRNCGNTPWTVVDGVQSWNMSYCNSESSY